MQHSFSHVLPEERIALRVKEAALISGLSRSTLYKLLKEQKLRGVKIAGRRLILREDLLALLQGAAGSGSPPQSARPARRTSERVVL